MNKKMIFYLLGKIIHLEALLMTVPLVCALVYGEVRVIKAFLLTIAFALVVGLVLARLSRTENKTIFAKEGFVVVALSWITLSGLGALPFCISGEIPKFVDAFFETVSGFTTTGASILTNVEVMSKGLLFWRSFTHWIGGLGILVLIMALLPSDTGRTIHIMRAEMPGPTVGKLLPKVSSTVKILYLIYIALTIVQVILLLFGGMSLFDSLVYTFGTAGTGGFGIKADSVGSYSPYIQWVITVFMLIFGMNFNLFFFILVGRIKAVLKSEELWVYISIVLIAGSLVGVNIYNGLQSVMSASDSIRHAFFQVSSIITTTGYATVDFNLWPNFSKTILLALMFIGACAGSTAGGFKVSRVIMLYKQIKSNLRHSLHTRSVESVKFEGKALDKTTLSGVTNYLAVYVFCFAAIFLVISLDGFSLETNFSAATSCFNNVGPGFDRVGPAASYAEYSSLSKYVLSGAMLLGRLEIYPLLLLFTPGVWKGKRIKEKI